MEVNELKSQIDIVEVISSYSELKKVGGSYQAKDNPLREDKHPNFVVSQTKQIWSDFALSESGDVIDFIMKVERVNFKEAISLLQEKYLGGITTPNSTTKPYTHNKPLKKKDNEALSYALHQKAISSINNNSVKKWWELQLETATKQRFITSSESVVAVGEKFHKLFESQLLKRVRPSTAKYIFENIIGYDSYFDCPTIIIRDIRGNAVDLIRYRPQIDGKPLIDAKGRQLKYLYTKSEEKPKYEYIYPFQLEMERLIDREGYVIVGEGIKNAINALMNNIPFISIESSSNIKPQLVQYLKSIKGIQILGAFDGDEAGERAYKEVTNSIQFNNLFSFDSGIDFTNNLRGENGKKQ